MSSILAICIVFVASPVASFKCSVGEHNPGDGQCHKCPPGKYQNMEGTSFCVSCPLGRYAKASGLSECLGCPQEERMITWRTGATRRIECVCKPGYFMYTCDNPSEGCPCKECPIGMLCPGGVSPPCVQRGYMTKPLPKISLSKWNGKFETESFYQQSQEFETEPVFLPDDRFHQMGCDHLGYHIPEDLQIDVFQCRDPFSECPGTCPDGGYLAHQKCLDCWGSKDRRWSCSSHGCADVSWSWDREEEIERCIAPVEGCPSAHIGPYKSAYKGMYKGGCTAPTHFRKVCTQGKSTIGCSSCAKFYFETPDGFCVPCGASGSMSMILVGILSPLLAFSFYKCFNIYNVEAEEDEARRGLLQCHVPPISMVKAHCRLLFFFVNYVVQNCTELMIEYIQVLLLILMCIGFPGTDPINGSYEYETRRGWVTFLASNIPGAETKLLGLKQGCATSTFNQRFTFAMIGPLNFGCIFFFNYFVSKTCCKQCFTNSQNPTQGGCCSDFNKTVNAVGTLIRTYFPVLCFAGGGALFTTYAHPSQLKSLTMYPEVLYQSDEWRSALPAGIMGIMVYFVCVPAFLARRVYLAPFNYHRRDFRTRFFFFFDGVKPNVYWWRLWKMFRNILLNICFTYSQDTRTQIVLLLIIMLISVALCLKFKGWLTRVQNIIEVGGCAAVIVLLTSILIRLDDPGENNGLTWLEVFALNLPIFLWLGDACISVRTFWRDGANGTQTDSLAQRLRDFLIAANCQSTIIDMDEFIGNLNHSEQRMVEEAMDTFFSQMLALQSSDSFLNRRLICTSAQLKTKFSTMPEGAQTTLSATAETIEKLIREKQAAPALQACENQAASELVGPPTLVLDAVQPQVCGVAETARN